MFPKRFFFFAPALLLTSLLASPVLAQRPPGGFPATFSDQEKAWRDRQALAASSLFAGLSWRPAGEEAGGGRVIDIEGVPGRPYGFYAAFDTGGLWRSDDDGVSFEPLWDGLPSPSIGDVAVDHQNPGRVWVGTGADGLGDGKPAGMGIYRSDDYGRSFRHAGLGGGGRIARIVVDPRDGNRVFVAVLGKLFTPGGLRGLYRTRDGGGHWERVLDTEALAPVGAAPVGAAEVALDPRDPRIVYAATWQHGRRPFGLAAGGTGSGIFKSEDGGDSWRRLEGGLPRGANVGRIGIAVSASRPEVVYAAIDVRDPLPAAEVDLGGTALSPQRLRRMTPEEFLAQDPEAVAEFLRDSSIDPVLDARALIAKVERGEVTPAQLVAHLQQADPDLFAAEIRGLELYRSGDGGASWKRTHALPLRGVTGAEGYDFGEIRVAPDDADRVFCLGRALIVSSDGGKTFKGVRGESRGDHHALYIDPASPRRMLLGSGGRLDASHDGGRSWLRLPAPGASPLVSPLGSPLGSPLSSPLGSPKAAPERAFLPGWPRAIFGRTPPRHQARPPIVVSFHDPSVVYFGGDQLYRSADGGATFAAIGPELTVPEESGNLPYGTLTAVAESPREGRFLWVGSDDGQVWTSDNGGSSWADAGRGLPAARRVSSLAASSFESSRAYLALDGSRDDDHTAYVYRTEDYGHTWIPIAAGLPGEPVTVVREDPVQREVVYAGTDRGVYVSLDRGRGWQALAAGLPTAAVGALRIGKREREIEVATLGRGVFRLDALPIRELPRLLADAQKEAELFPVATVAARRQWYMRRDPWRHDPAADPVLAIPFYSAREGQAVLELLDTGGRPLRRLELPVGRGISTFRWDLLLDERLALTAEEALATRAAREQAALEKERAKARKKDKRRGRGGAEALKPPPLEKGALAKTPWAEALRLGRPLYVTPGVYTLEVKIGGASAKTLLRVEKPEPPPARSRFELPRE